MSKERETAEGFDSLSRRLKESDRGRTRGGMLGIQGSIITSTPCAACKLLRRRCAQECPFAPYFSPHEPQKFASVHKIYGASNVSKMLLEVPENKRADAANSLVYEANARIRDPVYGCTGVISTLQQQAQSLQAELNAVRAEVLRYRCHETAVQVAAYPSIAHVERSVPTGIFITSHTSGVSGNYPSASPPNKGATVHTKERF